MLKKSKSEGVLQQAGQSKSLCLLANLQASRKPVGAETERRGFTELGRVEDYDRKVVYRHQQTLSKPKADASNPSPDQRAHCELIFIVYSDPGDEVGKLLQQSGPPTSDAR